MNILQDNLKLKAFFVGIIFFLLMVLIPSLAFGTNPLRFTAETPTLSFFSFLISIPLGISFYLSKKYLDSENPRKIFYKIPINIFILTVIVSLIMEVFFILFDFGVIPNIHSGGAISAFWPFYCWFYILGVTAFSFVWGIYLYYYKNSQHKIRWRWITTIVIILPILLAIFERMF